MKRGERHNYETCAEELTLVRDAYDACTWIAREAFLSVQQIIS